MTSELEPVWKQFAETYAALREALAEVPDARLSWKPGPATNGVDGIVQHVIRGNTVYANFMERGERGAVGEPEANPSRQSLLARLDESEQRVREQFERMTSETVRQVRAPRWQPLGPEAEGPHDALWFAMQMVRHTAYHLGQVNLYLLIWEGEGRA